MDGTESGPLPAWRPRARTIDGRLACARSPSPGSREGLGRARAARRRGGGGRCSLGRSGHGTAGGAPKPRSVGRAPRCPESGERIKAQVINAMLWPSSAINALS